MNTNTNIVSKSDRLLSALVEGAELSQSQIASRFGYSPNSVSKAIFRLRTEGFPIFTNKRTTKKGATVSKYRMGTAPRSVIAAGYRTLTAIGYNPLG